jgi:hypothetical protein
MLTTEQAARLVLASAIRDAIGDATEDIRAELRPDLNPGDRTTAIVDGVTVGAVQMTQTKPATRVVDYGALMAWAMEHAPAAIITTQTLNQAWVARILKDGGEWVDPDGVVLEVPGLGVSQASPILRVTQTDEAKAWAVAALEATMHSPLAITGGTHD